MGLFLTDVIEQTIYDKLRREKILTTYTDIIYKGLDNNNNRVYSFSFSSLPQSELKFEGSLDINVTFEKISPEEQNIVIQANLNDSFIFEDDEASYNNDFKNLVNGFVEEFEEFIEDTKVEESINFDDFNKKVDETNSIDELDKLERKIDKILDALGIQDEDNNKDEVVDDEETSIIENKNEVDGEETSIEDIDTEEVKK